MAKLPRYREIADVLRDRLATPGTFTVGDRFPTISELQDEFEVPGLNTVRQALGVLIDEGLLESVHGSGTFVRALPAPNGGLGTLRTDLAELQASLAVTQSLVTRVLRHLDDEPADERTD